MNARPSILCPVDFSDASAGALRYAAAIAARFHARLVVMSVDEPLVTEAVDLGTGIIWTPEDCRQEIVRFVNRTFDHEPAPHTRSSMRWPSGDPRPRSCASLASVHAR